MTQGDHVIVRLASGTTLTGMMSHCNERVMKLAAPVEVMHNGVIGFLEELSTDDVSEVVIEKTSIEYVIVTK